jgi:transposase
MRFGGRRTYHAARQRGAACGTRLPIGKVTQRGESWGLEHFPLDVNRNSHRGIPFGAQIRFGFLRRQRRGRVMAKGYSKDLRVRAVAIVEAGESAREAARLLDLGASTAIRWIERWTKTGSVDAKPGTGHCRSPLETHKQWLFDLMAAEPDLTLDEVRARLRTEKKLKSSKSSISRFYDRHDITFKKNSARCRAGSS